MAALSGGTRRYPTAHHAAQARIRVRVRHTAFGLILTNAERRITKLGIGRADGWVGCGGVGGWVRVGWRAVGRERWGLLSCLLNSPLYNISHWA